MFQLINVYVETFAYYFKLNQLKRKLKHILNLLLKILKHYFSNMTKGITKVKTVLENKYLDKCKHVHRYILTSLTNFEKGRTKS